MGKSSYQPVHTPEPGNEAPAVNDGELPVAVRLMLPQDLYKSYEDAALSQGLTVTELMMHRLRRCKDHNSIRPLYFNDQQRSSLETLVQKRPIETPDQALTLLTSSLAIRIGDFPPIPLSAQQVKRIGMSGYAGQTAEERLAQIVKAAISKAVGI